MSGETYILTGGAVSDYNSLENRPDLFSGKYEDLTGAPNLGVPFYYGQSKSSGSTVAKTVTVDPAGFELKTGVCVLVNFYYANTATGVTLNVNDTGAKAIKLAYSHYTTSTSEKTPFDEETDYLFRYDGTYWTLVNTLPRTATETAGIYSGTCSTTGSTAAKTVTVSPDGFTLTTGAVVAVYFSYANSASSATLNVNGTGAKTIRMADNVLSTSRVWNNYQYQTILFRYNGTYWCEVGTSRIPISYNDLGNKPKEFMPYDSYPWGWTDTAGSTQTKTVTLERGSFSLTDGSGIWVCFNNENTHATPYLNVNGTGAKPIVKPGVSIPSINFKTNTTNFNTYHLFIYNGLSFVHSGSTEDFNILPPVMTGSFNLLGTSSTSQHAFCYGLECEAHAAGSVAMGRGSVVTSGSSRGVAIGYQCTASASGAVALGYANTASASYAHSEGYYSVASGQQAHAEGFKTTASGYEAHAEGSTTTASGDASHAGGGYTKALKLQYAIGHNNNTSLATASTFSMGESSTSTGATVGTAFVIGNGYSTSASNACRITYSGQVIGKSSYASTGADYAEYFEWADGNPDQEDRRGYFVTLDGEQIRKARSGEYLLGIVSGHPCVIGNFDEHWRGQYEMDEWGDYIYVDEEGNPCKGGGYKVNPNYDDSQPYVPREDRPEWSAVGMLGKLRVHDDGSCQVNGFAICNDEGIATSSITGYRVTKRINDHIVEVIFR